MCVQRNVLGSPKNLAPPPWEYAFLNFWNLAPKTILYFKLPLFARGIVFHVFVSLFQSAAILIKTKLIYIGPKKVRQFKNPLVSLKISHFQ